VARQYENSCAIASKSNQIFQKGRFSDGALDSALMQLWLKTAMASGNTYPADWRKGRKPHSGGEAKMFLLIKRFFRDQSGATAMEYAMLVVFIGLAIAVGAQALGGGLSNMFNNIATTLNGVAIPKPPAP
jgi:pilus assembly protein Flp/PilA